MDSDKNKPDAVAVAPSRRRFVSTVATGIAASAAVAPAMAQQAGADMANQPPPGRVRRPGVSTNCRKAGSSSVIRIRDRRSGPTLSA